MRRRTPSDGWAGQANRPGPTAPAARSPAAGVYIYMRAGGGGTEEREGESRPAPCAARAHAQRRLSATGGALPASVAGTLASQERRCWTHVLRAHIAVDTAVFPAGTTGYQLDAVARMPLWQAGLDYRHGSFAAAHTRPKSPPEPPPHAPQTKQTLAAPRCGPRGERGRAGRPTGAWW